MDSNFGFESNFINELKLRMKLNDCRKQTKQEMRIQQAGLMELDGFSWLLLMNGFPEFTAPKHPSGNSIPTINPSNSGERTKLAPKSILNSIKVKWIQIEWVQSWRKLNLIAESRLKQFSLIPAKRKIEWMRMKWANERKLNRLNDRLQPINKTN